MKTFQDKNYKKALFQDFFTQLKDHRRVSKGNIKYSLDEIIFLTLSAVVSGCHTWESIEEFGELNLDWLQQYFPYKFGTPSHDTLGAFYGSLDKIEFKKCFMDYTKSLSKIQSKVVAIDGKTVRGVASNHGDSPIHIVSAFCEQNRLCLAQETVGEKTNEIDAIPKLLEVIALEGTIVTIDAMGCQKDIALKIREKKADYILQVKDNQKELNEQIKKLFNQKSFKDQSINYDLGHGRTEIRTCRIIDNLTFLDDKEDWKDLKTIIEIDSVITNKKTGKVSKSKRHYISSLQSSATEISSAIRSHWSIENNLHWNLDVIFKEDFQLKRKGNSVENFNMIIKIGLGLLEAEKTKKKSKPLKMLIASLNDSYRELIMGL